MPEDPTSHAARARRLVPRGGSRAHHFQPPIYLDRGEGAFVWDLDGNRYLDCNLCFGSMILGHADPAVTAAIRERAPRGVALGAPPVEELLLAEEIASRVSVADRVAFLSSGTEATMAAVRIARAATGRTLVAKCEGGWHGWNDHLLWSFLKVGGDAAAPEVVAAGSGLTDAQREQTLVLPYNSPAAIELLEANADQVAVLFVEGVQGAGGAIVGDPTWLRDLRECCRRNGIVFVCDEVITGFRVGPGGVAEELGLDSDIVTFGKIAGGGLPIGVVVGKESVMQTVAPAPPAQAPALFGTFSGNPLTMAAGIAQLSSLDAALYERLDGYGATVRAGLEALVAELGIAAQVTGVASLWGFHFTAEEVRDIRPLVAGEEPKRLALALGTYLREEGLLFHTPVHLGFVSNAHTEEDVAEIVDAHRRALTRMLSDGVLEATASA